jgi:RING finger family protein
MAECPICLDDLPEGIVAGDPERNVSQCPNKHDFHSQCFNEWDKQDETRSCPICRANVPIPCDLVSDEVEKIKEKFSEHGITTVCDIRDFVNGHVNLLPIDGAYTSEAYSIELTNMILEEFDGPELPVPSKVDNPELYVTDESEPLARKLIRKVRFVLEPVIGVEG